jgi:hypothetical protein
LHVCAKQHHANHEAFISDIPVVHAGNLNFGYGTAASRFVPVTAYCCLRHAIFYRRKDSRSLSYFWTNFVIARKQLCPANCRRLRIEGAPRISVARDGWRNISITLKIPLCSSKRVMACLRQPFQRRGHLKLIHSIEDGPCVVGSSLRLWRMLARASSRRGITTFRLGTPTVPKSHYTHHQPSYFALYASYLNAFSDSTRN